MSGMLRNPEVARDFIFHLLLTVILTAGCSFVDVRFAGFTLLLCLGFTGIHFLITARRYRRIASLTAALDRVLHGEKELPVNSFQEGELSILQSEIRKMTVRLWEQQQALMDDKIYLADSIADISHQIRTPLTSIHLLVELLAKVSVSDQKRRELCFELRELLARIDWLITALLKISRLDAKTVTFKKESLPLRELIDKACAPLLVPIELRGITLSAVADGFFCGDIAWTCEAIGNILKNCVEHTPEGGTIAIHAEENALYTQISIRDSGTGIPPKDLPHIFERFYKGQDSSDKSFGIGLSLARMIITSQNGVIQAENHPDGGTQFIIQLFKGTV